MKMLPCSSGNGSRQVRHSCLSLLISLSLSAAFEIFHSLIFLVPFPVFPLWSLSAFWPSPPLVLSSFLIVYYYSLVFSPLCFPMSHAVILATEFSYWIVFLTQATRWSSGWAIARYNWYFMTGQKLYSPQASPVTRLDSPHVWILLTTAHQTICYSDKKAKRRLFRIGQKTPLYVLLHLSLFYMVYFLLFIWR